MSTPASQTYVLPKDHKLLFENARVRVLEILLPPGETTGMHDHPSYLAYNLTPARVRIRLADGNSREIAIKQGDTIWSEALTHDLRNIGTTDSWGIIVELKQ